MLTEDYNYEWVLQKQAERRWQKWSCWHMSLTRSGPEFIDRFVARATRKVTEYLPQTAEGLSLILDIHPLVIQSLLDLMITEGLATQEAEGRYSQTEKANVLLQKGEWAW